MAPVLASRRVSALLIGIVGAMAAVAAAGTAGAGAATAITNCGGTSNLPPTTLYHGAPWAQRALDFKRVWPITEGADVTVAVIDTGVDARQPFLKSAVLPGYDVVNHGGVADTDCNGHGTFVAGLIAGRPLFGYGFAGVAPQAKILPIREADSTGSSTGGVLTNCIIAAVNRGAQVINVSITVSPPPASLYSAVQYALAHNVLVVAAAGNDYQQGNRAQYPASFPGVLAVGAVDQTGQRASFSENVPNVSVAAPGVNLVGPGASGPGMVSNSGTSFATAYVSGVAALVRSYYPRLSVPQVIRRIEATADHPPGNLPVSGIGWGEVNPYNAVTAVLPRQARTTAQAATPIGLPSRPVRSGAGTIAVAIGLGGSALAVAILLAGQVVVRGRRRGWRPGA